MSTVQYRGYQGDVVFEGDRLLLRILHIDDFITAEVDRASEVESAFAELVDDYLASCAELGKSPDRPFKGLFNVRVSPDLHRQAAFAAANERLTLNGFVTSALHEKLAKDLSHEENEVQVREPERVGEGFLRLSLVTCPVQILPAIGGPGELELDHGMLIEIDHFIPKHAVDSLYRSTAYYVTPLGKVGHDAYAVIREAIKATDKTAWVTLRAPGFERSCLLEARGNGMLLTALRPSSSIRNADNIFGSIQKVKVGQDMIDLATHIVDQKTGTFDPQAIKQEALKRSQKAALDDKKGARRKA